MSTAVLVNPLSGEPFPLGLAGGGVTTLARLGVQYQAATLVGAVQVNTPLSPSEGSAFAVNDAGGNAATNAITIAGSAGALIDGAASLVLSTNDAFASFVYDRGQWRRLVARRRIDGRGSELEFEGDAIVPPAAPVTTLAGAGGGNVSTLTGIEVIANGNPYTVIDSKIDGIYIAAGGAPVVTTLFTPAADGRYRVDAVVTCVDATGAIGANFTVRANFQRAAGVVSLLSGGSDLTPDASNTAGPNWTLSTNGTVIRRTATNATGVDVRFGAEVRAQIQLGP